MHKFTDEKFKTINENYMNKAADKAMVSLFLFCFALFVFLSVWKQMRALSLDTHVAVHMSTSSSSITIAVSKR